MMRVEVTGPYTGQPIPKIKTDRGRFVPCPYCSQDWHTLGPCAWHSKPRVERIG